MNKNDNIVMMDIQMIIEERPAFIGSFTVGRLLPFRQKRSVGPFVFIDHMGPVKLPAGANLDVLPHPHIGLSTLTYLLEGSILHRDSTGVVQEIEPGAVNWMTAGKGVVHSERTPGYLRNKAKNLHGLQIWVALPKHLEACDPSFHHIPNHQIPVWHEGELSFQLIAGEALGRKSPVPVHSPMYFIKVDGDRPCELNLDGRLFGECAVYILKGSINNGNQTWHEKQLLVLGPVDLFKVILKESTTLFIFGGMPFPEERFIYWNFVNSDKEVIEKAKSDWQKQMFPGVPGETEWVPLPGS